MSQPSQAIEKLSVLLQGSGANPVLVPSRLAPSAIYDLDYRTATVALVFENFAKSFGTAGHRRIGAARLKLLQFIVLRPWLLPVIREWSEESSQAPLQFMHFV